MQDLYRMRMASGVPVAMLGSGCGGAEQRRAGRDDLATLAQEAGL